MKLRNRSLAILAAVFAPVLAFAGAGPDPLADMAAAVEFDGVYTLIGVVAVAIAALLVVRKGVRTGWSFLK